MTTQQNGMPDEIYISGRYVNYADDVIFMKPDRQDPQLAKDIYPCFVKKGIITQEEARAAMTAMSDWSLDSEERETIRKLLKAHGGGE